MRLRRQKRRSILVLDELADPWLGRLRDRLGDLDLVQLLLNSGADLDGRSQPLPSNIEDPVKPVHRTEQTDLTDTPNQSALHVAAIFNRPEIAKILLERGLDVNTISTQNSTPLFNATLHNSVETVRILLDHGADPNIGWQDRITPLRAAEDDEIKQMLREAGAIEERVFGNICVDINKWINLSSAGTNLA